MFKNSFSVNSNVPVLLQVLDIVTASPEDTGPLNLNVVGRKDLSSSWVREEGAHVTQKSASYQVYVVRLLRCVSHATSLLL